MKYILFIFVLAFTIMSCDFLNKQESDEESSIAVDAAKETLIAGNVEGEVVEKIVVEDPVIEIFSKKDTLSDLSEFTYKILENDTVMYWKKGDINNDRIDDFIVVLQTTEEPTGDEDIFDAYQRKVVLLQTIGSYPNFKLRGINDTIIGCLHCGGAGVGDPFGGRGITIKENYFSIEQLYGACTKSFEVTTYKYDTNRDNWFLHKIGSDTYSCNDEPVNGEISVKHMEKTRKDFGEVPFEM